MTNWPTDCCGNGHHLFDHRSKICDRLACRCGALRGFLGLRNKTARNCWACKLRNVKPTLAPTEDQSR